MTSNASRNTPQKHTFAGEAQGSPLVKWLNSTGQQQQERQDIADALRMFAEVNEGMRKTGKETRFDAMEAYPESITKMQHIHSVLTKYSFRPTLLPGGFAGVEIEAGWVHDSEDGTQTLLGENALRNYDPAMAVLDIMTLGQKGLLSSVKLCACGCGRWLFAKFPQNRHYSGKCRVKVHHSKPGWKEYRREWKKNNREVHKRLEQGGAKIQARKGRRSLR